MQHIDFNDPKKQEEAIASSCLILATPVKTVCISANIAFGITVAQCSDIA